MVKVLTLLEEELPRYIHDVKSKHQENAKAVAFSSFVQKVFGVESEDLDFEVSVKTEVMQLRGRIDAVFGKVIIEFKKELDTGLEVAKEELKKYFQSYLERKESDFLGIANDGIHFKVFYPIIKNGIVEDVEEIDELNLDKSSTEEVFLWFDSYFFSSEKITPTSIDIKRRFGLDSPTFTSILKKLEILFDKVQDFKPALMKYESWNRYLEIVYGDKPDERILFFKHTYLSTLVKLLVHVKITGGKPKAFDEILPIIFGTSFNQAGIMNFIEDDFFSWIMSLPIRKQASKIFLDILRQLYVYDLDKIDEDVLKELYQELVDPDVRKLLGEFYTPDWLAESVVDEILKDRPQQSVMDPSCGSGTFLFKTIHYKINALTKLGWDKQKILEHIIDNVIGFDIHPLASIISRTNYLLALKDLLQYRRGSISIPVYLSDSLKIPIKNIDISTAIPTFEFRALDKFFQFPISVATDLKRMDEIVEVLREYGQQFELKVEKQNEYKFDPPEYIKNNLMSFQKFVSRNYNKDETEVLSRCLKTLFELILAKKDSIWPYVLRNMYKPVSISFKKIDVIVGNPPWLTMQGMKNNDYQNFLKEQTFKYNLIDKSDTHQFPHLELATLFFCMMVDLYLKENGKIAFVMPKSILVSSHHENFRNFNKPLVHLEKIFDVEEVEPLFRVPTCVIFGKKGEQTKYPIEQITIKGKLPFKNTHWGIAKQKLEFTKAEFAPAVLEIKSSPYFEKFSQGATLVPRNFFFVEPIKTSMGINLKTPIVASDERNDTKPPWSSITIKKEVDSEFLFGSLLGADIIPFGYNGFRMVVLPIFLKDGKATICKNFDDLQKLGFPKTARYFEEVELHWKKNSTDKQKNTSIYQWINYRNKITHQNFNTKYNVLYVASSTYLASCIVDQTKEMNYEMNDLKIKLNGFVAESKTYYFETNDFDEANYLCAILNSKTLDDLIKPLQTRGLWGPRDIHKRPLSLPIPSFNKKNHDHLKIAELGNQCSKKIPQIMKNINAKTIGSVRRDVRNQLSVELTTINELTRKIMFKEDNAIAKMLETCSD